MLDANTETRRVFETTQVKEINVANVTINDPKIWDTDKTPCGDLLVEIKRKQYRCESNILHSLYNGS